MQHFLFKSKKHFIEVLHWEIKVIKTRHAQINSQTLFIWQETVTVKSYDYCISLPSLNAAR